MLGDEARERGRAHERGVTRQHDDISLVQVSGDSVVEPGEPDGHRIAGAPRLELLHELDPHALRRFRLNRLCDFVGMVTHDDHDFVRG